MIDEAPATYVVTCDRCRTQTAPRAAKTLPETWHYVHSWDEGDAAAICDGDGCDGNEPATICGACTDAMMDWWVGPKTARIIGAFAARLANAASKGATDNG